MKTTHSSTVTPDQIDHLGHMNVRFYGSNALVGTSSVLAGLGRSSADTCLVDVYTRHHAEQLEGARLEVRSGFLSVSSERIDLYHELVNIDSDAVAATFVHGVIPSEGSFTGAAVADAAVPTVTIPTHGSPRSISLETDPISHLPSLDDALERGLAMRLPRLVSGEECDGSGEYLDDAVSGMSWSGETTDGRPSLPELIDGPNGERMGWASMETRAIVRRLPRRGDRIQAFSSLVDLTAKISHGVQWVYDLDRGDLLTTLEVVGLAFDTVTRQSMIIPPDVRARQCQELHVEFRPR